MYKQPKVATSQSQMTKMNVTLAVVEWSQAVKLLRYYVEQQIHSAGYQPFYLKTTHPSYLPPIDDSRHPQTRADGGHLTVEVVTAQIKYRPQSYD